MKNSILASFLIVAGCASDPGEPPPPAPRVHCSVERRMGSPVAPRLPDDVASSGWRLDVQLTALERVPESVLPAATTQVRTTTAQQGSRPFLALASFLREIQIGPLPAAPSALEQTLQRKGSGRQQPLPGLQEALPKGATVRLGIHPNGESDQADWTLSLHRPSSSNSAQLWLQSSDGQADLGLLDLPLVPEGEPLLAVMPMDSSSGDWNGLALQLSLSGDTTVDSELWEQALEPVAEEPDSRPVMAGDLWQGLTDEDRQRAVLAFLAAEHEAEIAEDLALSAPPAAVSRFAERLQDCPVQPPIGWLLDRVALEFLVDEVAASDSTAFPGFLLRHVGPLADEPSTVTDLIRRVNSTEDWTHLILAENEALLAESSSTQRLRAFDWLIQRGRNLGDFDPLASRSERRKALEDLANSESDANQP